MASDVVSQGSYVNPAQGIISNHKIIIVMLLHDPANILHNLVFILCIRIFDFFLPFLNCALIIYLTNDCLRDLLVTTIVLIIKSNELINWVKIINSLPFHLM